MPDTMRKYLTEFIGTFVFMIGVFGAVLTGGALAPIGIGAVLMVMVYACGHISGAHLNPAVSLAVLLRGRLSVADFVPYVLAQLLAALAGYLVSLAMYGDQLDSLPNGLDLSGHVVAAFLAELVFTFALCWVVLNSVTSRDHLGNSFYGLAIGFTVTAGAVAVGAISGAAFNPAITFGLLLGGVFDWTWIWLYFLAQLLGGAIAAVAFKAVNPADT